MSNRKNLKAKVKRDFYSAFKAALELIELEARKVLRENPKWEEFIMAMGICGFSEPDTPGLTRLVDMPKYAEPLLKVFDEWDNFLKLSGEPMRFTADGPVRREW